MADSYLIVHYNEIGLKGGNKKYFQKSLRNNLINTLRALGIKSDVRLLLGRFVSELPEGFDEKKLHDEIMKVPGVEYFGFFFKIGIEYEEIADFLKKKITKKFVKDGGYKSFCVRVKKSQEYVPFDRLEAEKTLGGLLYEGGLGLKVDLFNPDLLIFVELLMDFAFVAFGKHKGIGGLPTGTAGKVLSLISAGFDSPVAAFRMMKRGAKVCFVHFSGQPYSKREELEHVKDLVSVLNGYQGKSRLYVVPFGEIQKNISLNPAVPSGLRTVIYRRFMFKIAERIAGMCNAKALVTGESLAQVASQTLINLATIDQAVTNIPVLRPLIGMNKEEIIAESVKIGTHDISSLPCTDTCALFTPGVPETAAKIPDVLEVEKSLDVESIVRDALRSVIKD